jgi:hypothetical protein
MAQWTLTDLSTGTPVIYTFPINPNQFDPPDYRPNISEEQATAPTSPAVLFQGRPNLGKGSFSGLVASQAFYDNLSVWATKWYPMILTDDQGQTWNILISGFSKTRIRRAINQWRYDYTVEFIEVA